MFPMAETPAQHRAWCQVGISNRLLLVLMKVLGTFLDSSVRTNLLTSQLGPQEAGSGLSLRCTDTGGVQTGVAVPQQFTMGKADPDRQELDQDSGKTPKAH